tara:strand:- start:493 stop:714 length:222 start_codon:yes stop_codon:yes gene_type:complete
MNATLQAITSEEIQQFANRMNSYDLAYLLFLKHDKIAVWTEPCEQFTLHEIEGSSISINGYGVTMSARGEYDS